MDMLQDDYETISLSEILSLRDAYLNEEELWALCRECCLTLEYVRDSQDLFQGLCITPETVAFDHSGSVCFLDLDEEAEPLYIAPEFEDVGNSFKSHLFSLGMTMLYGIEYNIQTEEPKHELSSQLSDLLTNLCADDHKQRPSLEQVITQCDEVLKEKSSQDICHCMIDNFIRSSPLYQDGGSSILDLSAGLTSYLNTQSPHSPRQSTPQDLYQQTDKTPNQEPDNISRDIEKTNTETLFDKDIRESIGNQTESDEFLLSRLLTSEKKDSQTSKKEANDPDQFLISKLLDCSVPADTENCDEELAGLEISELNNAVDDENKEDCDKIIKENSNSGDKPSETVIETSENIIKNTDRKYSNILFTGEMECLDLASVLEITRERLDNLDLWSLISEGIIAIRKKKRHLPAFISPDTTVIKENGSIIFTGVPDGQKLETKYMAPELQQKGILSEKTCLYGLAMTLQTLSSNEDLDENLQDLLLSMLHSNCDKRPNINQALGICDNLQSMFAITSRQGCKILLQRAWNYYSEDETDYQNNNSLHESELQESSIESNNNYIETTESTTRHERKTTAPTPVSAFKPIHPENSPKTVSIGSLSSAFKPVAVKPQIIPKPKPVYEGNLSYTLNGREEEQINSSQQDEVKQPEKEPKVMKKLQDLEKHLSRHRLVDESKYSDQETNEVNNNSDTSVDKNTNSDFKPEDSLSRLLQKFDGQLPDTETLATAIAQYLQTQINGTSQKSTVPLPIKDLDAETEMSSSSSPSMPKSDQNISAGAVDPSVNTSPESSTTIQTFSMPIQNISGQNTSYPIQLQLQQDPKTGFVQLIPVGVMPYGSVVPQLAVPMNTGQNCVSEIEDDTIPVPEEVTKIQHSNIVGKPPIQIRSIKQIVKKPTQPRSRTRSQGYMSDSGILEKSDNIEDVSFPQFPNARKQIRNLQNELEQSFTGSQTSGTGHTKLDKTFLSDSGHFNQSHSGQRSFHQSGSRSANTSPSWSKDSGVSGLQPPNNTIGYNDKTLIDRLLNTDSSKHQQLLGEVLGVLRENHVLDDSDYDDFTVAEYVTSLGNLRIDTFTGAVSEKYHQIDWSYTLLNTLYGIINHSHKRNKVLISRNNSNYGYSDHRRLSAPSYVQNQQLKSSPDSIKTSSPDLYSPNSEVKYSPPLQSNPPELQRSHPLRSSLYRRTSGISETSDSTDTERREKRMKFKKRYQLDRSKSSSMTNIVNSSQNQSPEHPKLKCESESYIKDTIKSGSVNVPSPVNNLYRGDSSPGSVSMNLESDYVQLSGSTHDYENIDFTDTSKQFIRNSDQYRRYNRPVSDSFSIKSNQNGDQSKFGTVHRQDSFRQNRQFNRNQSKSENLQVDEVPKSYPEQFCSPDEMSSNSSSNYIRSAPRDQSNTSQYVPKIRKYEAKTNNNLTRRYVNKYSSDSESSRTDSVPLKARHDLGSQIQNGEKQASKKPMSTLLEQSETSLCKKIKVVYHWASVHTDFSGDLEEFSSHIDEGDKAGIDHQLLSVQQQLGMEKKMRRKSQKFYQKLIDPVKTTKDDQKGVTIQVLKDLEEMTRKVHFLQLCQTHLQMLLAEFNGINLQYSYSLSLDIINERLSLKSYQENPLLQFQYMVDARSNCEIQVLQAGDTQALMAYLFITCAISNGFIHQFLYTYRYFLTSDTLLNFIIHRYTAASRSDPNDPIIQCIKQRALDILYYWMEGFYNIDFELNKTLLFRLEQFLMTQLSHNDDKQESISELLRLCSHGHKIKFNNLTDGKDEEETTLYLKLESPKKWNSFKSLTRRSPAKRVQSFKDLTSITKACNNNDIDDGFYPRITKRNDLFTLLDYTPQILVEQLTLITQEIFQQSHPIQYQNSKANGICVALSLPGLCTPSMIRRRESGGESKNLFLGQWMPSKILDELISLSHNISQWVSGEIVSCSNPKAQAQLLTKFISVAQISEEIRNYSLCISIIDGLENVIVRQLPIWRNISSKYITAMESLSKMKLKLKSEPFYMIQDSNYTLYPTIPYTLYFLLHVQQLEMGSFTLANGFIKWTKMRTICQLVDQIRIFRSNEYGFEPNFDIQDNLLQRMEEFLHLDIQAIASQNDTNFRRMSTGGLQSVLRKMKDKLGKT